MPLHPDAALAIQRAGDLPTNLSPDELRVAYEPPGLNLWQSNGEAGGQEVFHFHLHVHPRQVDDGLLRVYPNGVPPQSDADELAAIARAISARLGP